MPGIPADAKAASRLVLLALVLAVMLPSLAAAQSIAIDWKADVLIPAEPKPAIPPDSSSTHKR